MSADQVKLTHQLILVSNVFLHLVDEREEKVYTRHLIGRVVSEAVRGWLTECSWTYS